MSSPTPPQPETQASAATSQAAQAAVALALTAALSRLWPHLDLLNLARSLPAFKAAVAQEVQKHAAASATLAARQYRAQRTQAGVRGGFTPIHAGPPPLSQIAATVDWATRPLWDTSVLVASLPEAPEETQQAAGSAIADAKARLAAASERLVLDIGQETITDNVRRDRRARGYARIPEPGCCSFCAMLAMRGAVYKNDSFAASNKRFVEHIDVPSTVKVHDHCRCHVEPVFTAYEPSARIREWQRLYEKATENASNSHERRLAFRQAFEGREVNLDRRRSGSAGSKAKAQPRRRGERTKDEDRAEMTALEKNLSRLTNDQQREWVTKRIAALRRRLGEQ